MRKVTVKTIRNIQDYIVKCVHLSQSQGVGWPQEQGELQRLRSQLQRAQDRVHAQELELERLRLLQDELGDSIKEQQVSCHAAAHRRGQVDPRRVDVEMASRR